MPEISRYAPLHHDVPSAPADVETRPPSTVKRPPPPQSTEPPPESAGMPTFKSVSEAAGAPPISPFEPPVTKNPDEERELQEFVANFRYNPPVESVDELTMRSEVPVLDAEAPVTPSHPSFDDDVPPPPEAGPHPTGEEYYPPTSSTADRSRFLDVTATPDVEPARLATVSSSPSFLGLDTPGPGSALPLDEVPPPGRSHWVLWSSLTILLVVFGILGYLQGRAQSDPTLPNPMAIAHEQYAKLRQRVTDLATPAPVAPAESHPATTAPAEPQQANPPPTDQTAAATQPQPETSANSNLPASQPAQSAATTNQQQAATRADPAQQQPQPASHSAVHANCGQQTCCDSARLTARSHAAETRRHDSNGVRP